MIFLCVREKKEKRKFNVPGTKVQEHGALIAEYQRHRLWETLDPISMPLVLEISPCMQVPEFVQ